MIKVGGRVFKDAEKNLPAEKEKEGQNTRVSEKDGKSRWAECFEETTVEGAEETDGLMLPKENRLTDDYDFRRVKRLGKNYHCPLFKLGLARRKTFGPPNGEVNPSRFGFVISTKIDKRAVVRNRIKRLLREAVRSNLEKIPDGFDLVFVVRPKIVGKSYEEVCSAVNQVLSEISFSGSRLGEETFSDR